MGRPATATPATGTATPSSARALRDLRRTRRRRHVTSIDIWDALYRAYLAALFGGFGLALVAGYEGGTPLGAATVARVRSDGPALVGLAVAVAVGLGLRSGAHGGPLALEPAEVQLVLLAPVDRRQALLGAALRQIRFAVFAGVVLGVVAGTMASRRLPGSWAGWVTAGAATGAISAAAAVGAALLVSGLRAARWASAAALAMVGWSTADLLWSRATSPATLLGQLATRPAGVSGAPWVGVACAVGVAAAGVGLLGGTAIPAAQRRSALLSQLRFAVTLQDVRSVVLLRRLLAQEAPRARPWLRLRWRSRHPVWRRDLRGVLRWPAVRIARLLVLGAAAGATLTVAWRGTVVVVGVAGVALFVAALDAVEGLAQDADLPVRRDTLPVPSGWLAGQHMVVPLLVMAATGGAGVAAATMAAPAHRGLAASVGAATIVPAALGAVCGAVLSVVSEPYDPVAAGALYEPELVASTRLLIRIGAAPGVATLGVLPVLAATSGSGPGSHPLAQSIDAAAEVTVVLAAFVVLGVARNRRGAR